MPNENSARYEHDCPSCRFLGSHNHVGVGAFDVYACPQHGSPTFVVRYGDCGPNYTTYNVAMFMRGAFDGIAGDTAEHNALVKVLANYALENALGIVHA